MSKSFRWFCIISVATLLCITSLLILKLRSQEALLLKRDQEIALLQEQMQEAGRQSAENEAKLKAALDKVVESRKKIQGLDEQQANHEQLVRDKGLLQQQLADLQKKTIDAESRTADATSNGIKARSNLAPRDNPNPSDEEKLEAIICAGHLHQIALAVSLWASTHDDHAPIDFVSLQEFLAPMILVCPSAKPPQPLTGVGWDRFDVRNITYRIMRPGVVWEHGAHGLFAVCPIHQTFAHNRPPQGIISDKYLR